MILVRHGQSEFNVVFNATRRDPGIRDPRLTDEGRRQARDAAETLRPLGLKSLIASPYTRALETAEILAAALNIPIQVEPLVGERAAFICDLGSDPTLLKARWPHLALDHLPETWWPTLEESEEGLRHRCERFRAWMGQRVDWHEVGVVTHWGFIRGLTGLTVPNGAVVRCNPERPELEPEVLRPEAR
jgi:glucosyl-3-phosphoglycerate phosphatase